MNIERKQTVALLVISASIITVGWRFQSEPQVAAVPVQPVNNIIEPEEFASAATDIANQKAAQIAEEQAAQAAAAQAAEQSAAQAAAKPAAKQTTQSTKQYAQPAQSNESYGDADSWASSSKSQSVINCESGGNYSISTGNGYYGAWQFDYRSWHANGGGAYAEYPHQATPSQQNQVAYNYYQKSGWRPWACG